MPLNYENLNGNGQTSELKRPIHPTQQPQQPEHFKQQDLGQQEQPQTIAQIQQQAAAAIAGLKQADLAYAGQAFERLGEQFEADTDAIAKTAEVLLDPRVKLAAGFLKAANRVSSRQEAGLALPFGGYTFTPPKIPGVPSFGQFYSPGQQAQPLLSSTSENSTSN